MHLILLLPDSARVALSEDVTLFQANIVGRYVHDVISYLNLDDYLWLFF